ncbi:MAG TPA: hypothetical protein VNP90_08760, partial [Actinomycetota bacterium]|nr:hypothetical protein [Actinomycetota bacterium]
VADTTEAVAETTAETTQAVVETSVETAQGAAETTIETAQAVVETSVETAQGAAETTIETTQGLAETTADTSFGSTSVVDAVWNTAETLITAVSAPISGTTDVVPDTDPQIIDEITDVVSDTTTEGATVVSDTVSGTTSETTDVVSDTSGQATTVVSDAASTATSSVDTVSNSTGSITDIASTAIDYIDSTTDTAAMSAADTVEGSDLIWTSDSSSQDGVEPYAGPNSSSTASAWRRAPAQSSRDAAVMSPLDTQGGLTSTSLPSVENPAHCPGADSALCALTAAVAGLDSLAEAVASIIRSLAFTGFALLPWLAASFMLAAAGALSLAESRRRRMAL